MIVFVAIIGINRVSIYNYRNENYHYKIVRAQVMACQALQYCMWKYMCCISKYLWAKTYICGLKKIFMC